MKASRWLLALVVLAGCAAKGKPREVFVVPEGFTGPVMVGFSGEDPAEHAEHVYRTEGASIVCDDRVLPWGMFGEEGIVVVDEAGERLEWSGYSTGEWYVMLTVGPAHSNRAYDHLFAELERTCGR